VKFNKDPVMTLFTITPHITIQCHDIKHLRENNWSNVCPYTHSCSNERQPRLQRTQLCTKIL